MLISIRLVVSLEDILHLIGSEDKYPSQLISAVGSFNSWDVHENYLNYNFKSKTFEATIECEESVELYYKFFLHSVGKGDWIEPSEKHTIAPLRQIFKNEYNSANYLIKVPKIRQGTSRPFGLSISEGIVNLSVYATNVTQVSVCIYGESITTKEGSLFEIPMGKFCLGCKNCVGDGKCIDNMWNIAMPTSCLPPKFFYIFKLKRKQGSVAYASDPFCKYISGGTCEEFGIKKKLVEKELFISQAIIGEEKEFDWNGDACLNTPIEKTIIYEMHVRGFTKAASSNVGDLSGTYLGLAAKAEYLKNLGITAVELLPIHEFDETNCAYFCPNCSKRLTNYWGYSTINFFSPMARYASKGGDARKEFKIMVKELHKHGIEVILDVVYNHVDLIKSPFDSLSKDTYFILDKDKSHTNFTGCGNTIACNYPMMAELIVESLNYWVTEFHVDGFRFDLAAIFCRRYDTGAETNSPLIIEKIVEEPILATTKLIAEAWDLGIYKVGSFPHGERWIEWNDIYRDNVRKCIRGDELVQYGAATSIAGSPNIFSSFERHSPYHSLNFVTAHDGFTLRDIFSYNRKHNISNGEGNRDGSDNNYSFNYGVEGPVGDAHNVENPESNYASFAAIRLRQIKNSILMLFISRGVPMLQAGDEYGRTTLGNNNMWNQDTQFNHFDWSKLESDEEGKSIFAFTTNVIKLRSMVRSFNIDSFGMTSMSCHRPGGVMEKGDLTYKMEWYQKDGSCIIKRDFHYCDVSPELSINLFNSTNFLSFVIQDTEKNLFFYIAFNASHLDVDIIVPKDVFNLRPINWCRLVDTSFPYPDDFVQFVKRVPIKDHNYKMTSYSSVVFVSEVPKIKSTGVDEFEEIKDLGMPKEDSFNTRFKKATAVEKVDKGSIKKSLSTQSFFIRKFQ